MTIHMERRGSHGPRGSQGRLVDLLGMLSLLGDEDRIEVIGCQDPAGFCRLVEYAGCKHSRPRQAADGWKFAVWRTRGTETVG